MKNTPKKEATITILFCDDEKSWHNPTETPKDLPIQPKQPASPENDKLDKPLFITAICKTAEVSLP